MPDYTRIASAKDIPVGQVRVFIVNDQRVAVANVGGQFYALDDVCTHDGGPLGEGNLDGHAIICPRHGARFDVRSGAALAFPAITPVNAYPTKAQDGEVWAAIET